MGKVIDQLSEKTINVMFDYLTNSFKGLKKRELWKNAVRKACKATEGIDESFADNIVKLPVIQRYFVWLIGNKKLDDVYYSFIISIAVELCKYNCENEYAVSLGTAILDNWFTTNGIDYSELKKIIIGDKIVKIVNDRERLYREYFTLYNDPISKDVIRVYYPKNGENWVGWDKKYSIDIKVNLSKGVEFGFCKIGFSYSRIKENGCEKFLKVAYICEDREIFRFEHEDLQSVDENRILWEW